MEWSFLDKYKHREIENGHMLLELTPVKGYSEIFICVDKKDDIIMPFDGGSTVGVLKMVYNFSSKVVKEKLVEICRRNRISCKNDIFYLHCKKENFDERLQDFIKALNEICHI